MKKLLLCMILVMQSSLHAADVGVSIAQLGADDILPRKNLESGYIVLDLSFKNINNLDGLLEISGIEKVQEISLWYNRISKIKAGAFKGLNEVLRIHLNRNPLTDARIEPGAFAGFPKVKYITFSGPHTLSEATLKRIASEPTSEETNVSFGGGPGSKDYLKDQSVVTW